MEILLSTGNFTDDDSKYKEIVYPEASFGFVKYDEKTLSKYKEQLLEYLSNAIKKYILQKVEKAKKSIAKQQAHINKILNIIISPRPKARRARSNRRQNPQPSNSEPQPFFSQPQPSFNQQSQPFFSKPPGASSSSE